MEKSTRAGAYISVVSAMLIFGTVGVFRRFIPLSSGLLAAVRGLLGTLVLVLFLTIRRKPIFRGLDKKQILWMGISGGLIALNWILLFEAYNYTTVPMATLCYSMEPTFVILLSPLFLRERLTPKKLTCAAIALVGMALVSGVTEEGGVKASDVKGIVFGLAAAAMYAAVIFLNKKVPMEDACVKTAIQLMGATVTMVPYLLLTEDFSAIQLDTRIVVMTLILGIFHTGFNYALDFYGMQKLPGQSVAILSYIDPVFTLVLSAALLHETLTPAGVVGAVLIMGSALVCELHLKKKA